MQKQRKDLKLLLLQIRDDKQVRREEYQSFVRYCGLAEDQVDILNVFDNPDFSPDVIDNYDALLVGGASGVSVLEPEKYPFIKNCIELLRYCIEKSIPTFASCFGFQLAVIALGGEIVRDERNFEIGTPLVYLTDAARNDLIFQGLPDKFPVVSVHQEKAMKLPEDCELLAYNDICCHSFKIKNKPFWAFQFHPEIDKERLIERLGVYKDIYTESDEHYKKLISTFCETPESNELPKRFIDKVLIK